MFKSYISGRFTLWVTVCITLLSSFFSGAAGAALLFASGQLTTITGEHERLVSYRHQERLWITADGAYHLIANVGSISGTDDLALLVRNPITKQWQQVLSFSGTDSTSTADTVLIGNQLHIVYSSNTGTVQYASSTYDPGTGQWSTPAVATVYNDSTQPARAPTIAVGGDGKYYAAFTVTRVDNGLSAIRVYYSQDPLSAWSNSGKRWGTLNIGTAKAGRIIKTGTGISLIYTDTFLNASSEPVNNIRWSQPTDMANLSGTWEDIELFQTLSTDQRDPYGTHFNAINDDAGNLHLLWAAEKKIRYFRYDITAQTWSHNTWLQPADHRGAYSQLVLHQDGRLFAIFNVCSYIMVMQSVDNGLNFESIYLLTHPDDSNNWNQPRIESPARITGTLDVLQQLYVGDITTGHEALYGFELNP